MARKRHKSNKNGRGSAAIISKSIDTTNLAVASLSNDRDTAIQEPIEQENTEVDIELSSQIHDLEDHSEREHLDVQAAGLEHPDVETTVLGSNSLPNFPNDNFSKSSNPQPVQQDAIESSISPAQDYLPPDDSELAFLKKQIEQKLTELEIAKGQLTQSAEHAADLEIKVNELERRILPLGAQIGKLKEKLKLRDDEIFEANEKLRALDDQKEILQRLITSYQTDEGQQLKKSEELARKYQFLLDFENELEARAAEFSPERVKILELDNDNLKRQLNVMTKELDERKTYIELLESELSQLGRKDITALREQNQSLVKQVSDLMGELEEYRQNAQNFIHLKKVLAAAEKSEKERVELLEKAESLSARLEEAKSQIDQGRTDRALYLQAKIQVEELQQALENQNNKEEIRRKENEHVYDSLRDLLREKRYINPKIKLTDWPGDGKVISNVKNLAQKNHFKFEDYLIRAFLAAIRSSRLIILKGFSGTGKSSLPQFVANAMGAPCEMIPVQPSWKSKIDLLGFYNHFDQRFIPTAFTRALVKSLLPAFENRHFFILLDELNLARVEYYFSDFNSKLQSSEPKIELFENAALSAQLTLNDKTLIDRNTIIIPKNVTFIGTINDDETTFPISDKIYDRAQVIDFQSVGDQILKGEVPQPDPKGEVYSYSTYEDSWDQNPLNPSTEEVIQKFLVKLNRLLNEKFYLNLSYRPRAQIIDFMRAYNMSSGAGSLSEALDLQVVSKVIPKIRYTHHGDFDEDLQQFFVALQKDWPFDNKSLPYTDHALRALRKQG